MLRFHRHHLTRRETIRPFLSVPRLQVSIQQGAQPKEYGSRTPDRVVLRLLDSEIFLFWTRCEWRRIKASRASATVGEETVIPQGGRSRPGASRVLTNVVNLAFMSAVPIFAGRSVNMTRSAQNQRDSSFLFTHRLGEKREFVGKFRDSLGDIGTSHAWIVFLNSLGVRPVCFLKARSNVP